jgi:FdhE protein
VTAASRSPAPWATRRARALRLSAETPHAAEILTTYATTTQVQERIAAEVPVERWLAAARDADAGTAEGPLLRLDRLPLEELLPLFTRCLEGMVDVGTAVMRQEAERLAAAPIGERRALLVRALSMATAATAAGAATAPGGPEPAFHAVVFLEAIATPLAAAATGERPIDVESNRAEDAVVPFRCRACGGRAVVATLRDRAGALGARALVCGLCGSERRVRRLTCVHCGETDAERLPVHEAESVPHVRLDECRSCGRYLKCVDLRRRGDAVPVVEELATVELDLWAQEQGLTKLHTNVFGL